MYCERYVTQSFKFMNTRAKPQDLRECFPQCVGALANYAVGLNNIFEMDAGAHFRLHVKHEGALDSSKNAVAYKKGGGTKHERSSQVLHCGQFAVIDGHPKTVQNI